MTSDEQEDQHRIRIGDRYLTTDEITALISKAVRNALADHKAAGNPVADWRDGKVVIVPPEEIDLFENKWVYADLHKTLGSENELALVCRGTLEDLKRHQIDLCDGLNLTFWMDDGNDQGYPDPLVFRGAVRFDSLVGHWIAEIDTATMRHASKLGDGEIDNEVIEQVKMAMTKQRLRASKSPK